MNTKMTLAALMVALSLAACAKKEEAPAAAPAETAPPAEASAPAPAETPPASEPAPAPAEPAKPN